MTPEQDQPNATASDSLQQAEYVMTDEERVARALRDKAQHVEQVETFLLLDHFAAPPQGADPRLWAVGKTQIELGLMALKKALRQ